MLEITAENINEGIKNFKSSEHLNEKFKGIVHPEDGFPTDDEITKAMDCAWKDLMMRTLSDKPEDKKIDEENTDEKKGFEKFKNLKEFNSLREKIQVYFSRGQDCQKAQKNQKGFDEWHNEVCEKVLVLLRKQYKNKIVNYGKAQKLVNMIFKYLYCFLDENEREQYENDFKFCHMPFDSIMLEWIKREMLEDLAGKDFRIGNIPAWSNLEFSKDRYIQNNYYTYKAFIDISRYLIPDRTKKGDKLTPLMAEFVIWPKMRLKLAAEEFLNQLGAYDEEEGKTYKKKNLLLNEESLKNDLERIENEIKNI